jgi:hypothetical protein
MSKEKFTFSFRDASSIFVIAIVIGVIVLGGWYLVDRNRKISNLTANIEEALGKIKRDKDIGIVWDPDSTSNKFVFKDNVWYQDSSLTEEMIYHLKPELDPQIKKTIARYVEESAEVLEVPADIIIGLMWKESRFNPMAVSKKGAVGLMQVMWNIHEEKAKELGITKERRFWVQDNIRLGVNILRSYLDETESTQEALGKYLGEDNGDYVIDVLTTAMDLRLFVKEEGTVIRDNIFVDNCCSESIDSIDNYNECCPESDTEYSVSPETGYYEEEKEKEISKEP